MDIFEWSEDIPVTANNLNEMQNIINNNISKETLEVYSTSERKIGTWIDGKPVYRTCLNYSLNTGSTSHDVSSLNINILTKFNALLYRINNANTVDYEPPYYNGSTDYFRSFFRKSTNNIETRLASSYNSYRQYVILEYTKTTDV